MSSDAEDYDGDTNWDEIAAIRDALSPRRPRVQTSAPSGTSPTRSLSRPLEGSDLAAVQSQVQTSGLRDSSARTNRVATTAAPTPAVTRGNHTNGRSRSISRSNENSRVQNIISALSSHSNANLKKVEESSSANLSKGKRKRSNDDLEVRKNKLPNVKDVPPLEDIRKMLNGYDDELSCPICLDFFLAPQLLNPCGHTVCGDCLDHWLSKSSNRQCPTCRANLSYPSTHLPNYAIGGTVDRYIELQRVNKDAGWLEGGAKWKERQSRKRAYEVVKEMKNTQANKPAPRPTSAMSFDFLGHSREHLSMYVPFPYIEHRTGSLLRPVGDGRTRVAPSTTREIIQISSDDEGEEGSD